MKFSEWMCKHCPWTARNGYKLCLPFQAVKMCFDGYSGEWIGFTISAVCTAYLLLVLVVELRGRKQLALLREHAAMIGMTATLMERVAAEIENRVAQGWRFDIARGQWTIPPGWPPAPEPQEQVNWIEDGF